MASGSITRRIYSAFDTAQTVEVMVTFRLMLLIMVFTLAACGGGDTTPSTRATISGDLTAELIPNTVSAIQPIPITETLAGLQIVLNQDRQRVLFIQFPADTVPGTYPIQDGTVEPYTGANFIASYIDRAAPGGPFNLLGTSGTITFTTTGEAFSGSFALIAVGGAGADTGDRTVNIDGIFADLRLQASN